MSVTGWTPVDEKVAAWTPVEETPATSLKTSGKTVPNARIRNLPNPAEGMTPTQAAFSGASTGLTAATLPMAVEAPVEAAITKSIAPLYPIARSLIGAIAGKYIGREAGGLVGQPEIGGEIGGIGGAIYGGAGGKIPTRADLLTLFEKKTPFSNPGAALPSVEEFYANRGKDLMTAMRQQPEAFGLPSHENLGGPLPSTEKFYEMRGREIMAAIKQQPEAFGMAKGQLAKTSTPSLFEEGGQQDLISRTKKIVQPGEPPSAEDLKRAGDLTQAPLSRLKLLASWGDKLAQNEINRRLRNP